MVALANALRALVVDDDQGVRSAVVSVLEASGFLTVHAANRMEAIVAVRVQPVHFGIVDVNVSADDGLQIVGEVRAVIHRLPFIIMSGALTPEVIVRARRLGAHQCLEKPLDLGRLREAVWHLVEAEGLRY
jgi:DNA-binding NtrC family response regulator